MKKLSGKIKVVPTGTVIGDLTVTGMLFEGGAGRAASYSCKCRCGRITSRRGTQLRNLLKRDDQDAVNCGSCLVFLTGSSARGKALYMVWYSMIKRCHEAEEGSADYDRYRGRGIRVWKKWRHDKLAFARWALSNGFAPGKEIDRIDNDGNYKPSNCRFVTRQTNVNNRECSKWVVYRSKKARPFREVVDKHAVVSYTTAFQRYYSQGWDLHSSLTTPARQGNYR